MIRSGSICVSFIYNYIVNEIKHKKVESGKDINEQLEKLLPLSEKFKAHGGVFAKLLQLLCVASNDKDNDIFSDSKPYSYEKTIEYFKNKVITEHELYKNVDINFTPCKGGSIGQVYRAVYNEKDIILKVQYTGLKEQVESDLFLINIIFSKIYSFVNISSSIEDIRQKLTEELDYKNEFQNHTMFYELWKDHKFIKIPKLIPEFSNESIISMEYIEGEPLNIFINNSSQQERNHIGILIIEFIFVNLYHHNLFYSDLHFGNFIVKDKRELYVMDFGCIHKIDPKTTDTLRNIYISFLNKNKSLFFDSIINLGIICENTTDEILDNAYNFFKLQYEPWLLKDFVFTDEWMKIVNIRDPQTMKNWKIPPKITYLNKIPFNGYSLLHKLDINNINLIDLYKSILKV
jgi:predicted unusual protein kinase regulating ubiquinone biosynthesis (AarF/ABC1/UbiB family)